MAQVVIVLLIMAVLLCLCIVVACKKRMMTVPFLYRQSAGGFYTIGTMITDNPLAVDMYDVQIIEKSKLALPSPLQMMADPFVVRDKNKYYIFYEELTQKKYAKGADIAVLESADGISWKRLGVALRELFHLSFPNVFQWKGEWYMMPEADACGELRIYKAKAFPMKWEVYTTPIKGQIYADPMIFFKDEIIYLWYNTYIDNDELRLLTAKDLKGPWSVHPASPIRKEGNDTRPSGSVYAIKDELYYFVQNHSEGYGTGVIAYQIDKLSLQIFADHKLKENPFLWKNGTDWCRDGMHQYSFTQMPDGQYLCVMDGINVHQAAGWKWDWKNIPIIYKRNHV